MQVNKEAIPGTRIFITDIGIKYYCSEVKIFFQRLPPLLHRLLLKKKKKRGTYDLVIIIIREIPLPELK